MLDSFRDIPFILRFFEVCGLFVGVRVGVANFFGQSIGIGETIGQSIGIGETTIGIGETNNSVKIFILAFS